MKNNLLKLTFIFMTSLCMNTLAIDREDPKTVGQILFGINFQSNLNALQFPKEKIDKVYAWVLELGQCETGVLLRAFFASFCLEVNNLDATPIYAFPDIVSTELLEGIVEDAIERGICDENGLFDYETRTIFLACFCPLNENIIRYPNSDEFVELAH